MTEQESCESGHPVGAKVFRLSIYRLPKDPRKIHVEWYYAPDIDRSETKTLMVALGNLIVNLKSHLDHGTPISEASPIITVEHPDTHRMYR